MDTRWPNTIGVSHVGSQYGFERSLNAVIDELIEQGSRIIDIKYATTYSVETGVWHDALIIWEATPDDV